MLQLQTTNYKLQMNIWNVTAGEFIVNVSFIQHKYKSKKYK